jgi:hypothetical protein
LSFVAEIKPTIGSNKNLIGHPPRSMGRGGDLFFLLFKSPTAIASVGSAAFQAAVFSVSPTSCQT